MIGAAATPQSPSPIRHAQVQRSDIIRLPRQLDLLGAPPTREVRFLRLNPIRGGHLDTFA